MNGTPALQGSSLVALLSRSELMAGAAVTSLVLSIVLKMRSQSSRGQEAADHSYRENWEGQRASQGCSTDLNNRDC